MIKDHFHFRGNEMKFWRLGGINSVSQKYRRKDADIIHQAPSGRGIWVFPFGHQDLFFCWHVWESYLPKKFRKDDWFEDISDEAERAAAWEECDALIKEIRKRVRPSTFFYGGKFFSHISPVGEVSYNKWFLWDSPKHWAMEARKHIYTWENPWGTNNCVVRYEYSADHLEIFIPNY